MKKLLVCCALLVFAMLSTSALALDRANTAQKGSLLVFPRIDVSPGHETIIRIENGYFTAVDVKCYWQNGQKHTSDFKFRLTKFQPYVIIASQTFPRAYGPYPYGPLDRGELKCWAVSPDGQKEISFNHLSGTATIVNYDPFAYKYTAWAFRCLAAAKNPRAECGKTPGRLETDGKEYDYCPKKLTIGFSPTGAVLYGQEGPIYFGPSRLTVASCNQDFRQDRVLTYTKLDFKVWRYDEVLFTGAYSCMNGWHETYLDHVQNNPQNFSYNLIGDYGRFVVKGVRSTVCDDSDSRITTTDAGLVGVLGTVIEVPTAIVAAGTNLVGFGQMSGFVWYDPHEDIPEGPASN